jgi:hypothetical protein
MKQRNIDFSEMDFDKYQITDLRILMSLKTSDDIIEWAEFVGEDDVCYGISLLECAALYLLDQDVADMKKYPEAMSVIQKVKN